MDYFALLFFLSQTVLYHFVRVEHEQYIVQDGLTHCCEMHAFSYIHKITSLRLAGGDFTFHIQR